MLINTVILFLKDLLPIFILFCLLKSNNANVIFSMKAMMLIFFISLFGIIATFKFLPSMSELWGGVGIEVIQTIEILFVYVCLVFSYSYVIEKKHPSKKQLYLTASAIVIFIILNASVFIVFLDSYIISNESANIIIAGLAIGLGICLSFSALLFFLLRWLNKKKYYLVTYSFWALFLTGQVSQIVNLLQQVDIIQSSEALWDSSTLVEDRSEYGHLLKTLFGYEASSSVEFILLYVVSLLIFIIYFLIYSRSNFDESIDSPVGE